MTLLKSARRSSKTLRPMVIRSGVRSFEPCAPLAYLCPLGAGKVVHPTRLLDAD